MKKTLAIIILLTMASIMYASVLGLKGTLPYAEFVMGEAIPYTLVIDNHGATTFLVDDFGEGLNNKVELRMRKRRGEVLDSKTGMHFGEILVLPDKAQTYQADLTHWFNLTPGSYQVEAVVIRGDVVVATPLLSFAIVPGLEIGTLKRAIPGYDTMTRDYTVLYWPRKGQEILFLRVTEHPSGVTRMLELGNVVRSTDPKVEFTDRGTLIITHQASRNVSIITTIISERFRFEVINRERIVRPDPPTAAPPATDKRNRR